jgi:threonine-phosphate decarboxylase
MEQVCHYPDRTTWELRQALAGHVGLTPNHILVGNGSTALIQVLARAMDLKSIAVLAPAFGEFARSLAITGRPFHFHVLKEANGFLPTRDDLDAVWETDPACLVLTNPGTPTGGLIGPEVPDYLLWQAKLRHTWVILDEAFMDFCPDQARAWSPPLVRDLERLLVLRSLTKFYCLAGLRLGYLMGHPDTLAGLAPLCEPWAVNTLAQKAGIHCLTQTEYGEKTRAAIQAWRAEQGEALQCLGLKVMPGQVNYLLTHLPEDGPNAHLVASACAEQGVLMRDCADFVGCSPWHLRVAVATSEEQKRLIETLKPALKMWLFGGSFR